MLYDPRWEIPAISPWRQRLFAAADRLERGGWCQHVYQDAYGRRCIKAAIDSGGECSREASAAVARVIGFVNFADWNDAPERTAEEVIAALRKAAT